MWVGFHSFVMGTHWTLAVLQILSFSCWSFLELLCKFSASLLCSFFSETPNYLDSLDWFSDFSCFSFTFLCVWLLLLRLSPQFIFCLASSASRGILSSQVSALRIWLRKSSWCSAFYQLLQFFWILVICYCLSTFVLVSIFLCHLLSHFSSLQVCAFSIFLVGCRRGVKFDMCSVLCFTKTLLIFVSTPLQPLTYPPPIC